MAEAKFELYDIWEGDLESVGETYARHRIPGMLVTHKGTLIIYNEARYDKGDWALMDVFCQRSEDGGKSFGERIYLANGTETHKTVNNPVMMQDRNGRIHFLYCEDYGVQGGRLYRRYSDDDGLSWSEKIDITEFSMPAFRNCIAFGPGHGICLQDGTIMVPQWLVPKFYESVVRAHGPAMVGSFYSRDNGETWAELGIATDISSSDLFTAVYRDANDLVLELRDGTSYRIPIGSSLSIEYDCGPVVTVEPGSTRTIHYTVDSSTGEATVEVFSSADLLVKTENETALEGDIVVKCGAALTEYSKIVVLVHNGLRVHTDRFSFEEEGLVLSDNSEKTVAATAGTVELEFMTNAEFEVVVPTDVTWITVSETRALVAHGATLSILANEGLKRSAQVKVKSKTSDLEIVYTIIQEGTLKQLGITHRLGAFTVPTLTGDTTSGLVNWGDGASDSWSAGLSHNYIDNQASHTVVIAMKGIDSFALGNLTGITEIDASAL